MKVKLHHRATAVRIGTPKETIIRNIQEIIGLDSFGGGGD
jgi:hypothetical protein